MDKKGKYQDNYIEKLKEYGYIYISGKYNNAKSLLKCFDENGYIVYVCFDKIENSDKSPWRFHPSNDCSVFNIQHYIELHPEITCEYISGEYSGTKSKQIYQCECGELFETTFDSVRYGHKTKCGKCVTHRKMPDGIIDNGFKKIIPYEEVKEQLEAIGLEFLMDKKDFKTATSQKLPCKDKNGYKFLVSYDSIMHSGKVLKIVNKVNPYSIENINHYLDVYSNGRFICLSNEYKNRNTELIIKDNECGRIFKQSWANIYRTRNLGNVNGNRTGARCPFCDNNQLESVHALVLKQIWLHEYPNTVVEDDSCINPKTNHSMPTDIVNHDLKIAIEIQSWFHDFPDQHEKDLVKKKYWIERGYDFYDPDQRDYSVLEMVQLFFPSMTEIPEYIDFGYSNKINVIQVQKLLDEGYTVPEISKTTKYNKHQIYDAVHYGELTYPKNYKRPDFSPVVQLDMDGNFIARYSKIKDAIQETGVKNISSVLLSGKHYSGGYYWVREKEYDNGDYILTSRKNKKNNIMKSSETAGLAWQRAS